MGKRRKRKRWDDEEEAKEGARSRASRRRWRADGRDDTDLALRAADGSGKRRRRFQERDRGPEPEPERPRREVTCWQCGHLVVTRSLVKSVGQSWDRAVAYPTLTCFQQRWTLEDPDSVPDHAAVSEYLVAGAERCPDFTRGLPRNHDW